MRLVAIPPPANDRHVIWSDEITGARYLFHNRERWIVLTYRDGAERRLHIHQARALWDEIMPVAGCGPPCWFDHDVHKPPESCAECKLGCVLNGVLGEMRPPPIKQPDPRGRDWRTIAIVVLCVALWMAIYLPANQQRESPTPAVEGKQKIGRR